MLGFAKSGLFRRASQCAFALSSMRRLLRGRQGPWPRFRWQAALMPHASFITLLASFAMSYECPLIIITPHAYRSLSTTPCTTPHRGDGRRHASQPPGPPAHFAARRSRGRWPRHCTAQGPSANFARSIISHDELLDGPRLHATPCRQNFISIHAAPMKFDVPNFYYRVTDIKLSRLGTRVPFYPCSALISS